MKNHEQVETDRLILRRPHSNDVQRIYDRYAHDPEVTRWLAWPRHESLEDTRGFLAFCDLEWQRGPVGPYLIESRAGGRLLGSTGLSFETPYRAMTGYVLAKDAWGNGFATESLRAIVEIARRTNVVRLAALCHEMNTASWRVLEKCGFAREGVLRRHSEFPNWKPGEPWNVLCYSLVVNEPT